MAKAYAYLALNDNKKGTRILTLTGAHPLRGNLNAVAFSEKLPEYTALSYTWSDPCLTTDTTSLDKATADTYTIEIDGLQLPITGNLRNALSHLFQQETYMLWVDAICIDQNNTKERSDQVSLMRSIYSGAQKVVVWLGARTVDSDMAMDHLALLARHANRPDDPHAEQPINLTEPKYLDAWLAIKKLLLRSWWKRAWVIQEVALAPRVKLACGGRTLSELQLVQVQQVLTKEWYMFSRTEVMQTIWLTSRDLEPMLNLLRMRTHFQQGKALGQLAILSLTRESEASDPRDAIFAKYGLMGQTALTLYAPDYTMPFETVCKEFAWAYIQSKKDLSILCYAGISAGEHRTALPTWVPDWGAFKPRYPLQCSWSGEATNWPRYNAAMSTAPSVRLVEDTHILEAEGILIDTIDGVQSDPWCRRAWEQKPGSQSKNKTSAFVTHPEVYEALWRTVTADTHRQEAPLVPIQADPEFGILFAKAAHDFDEAHRGLGEPPGVLPTSTLNGLSSIEQRWHRMRHLQLGGTSIQNIVEAAYQSYVAAGHMTQRRWTGFSKWDSFERNKWEVFEHSLWAAFEHSYKQAMYHRRLFTTIHGYFGIGPRTLVPGDRIAVLLGCTLPLILRQTERSEHYRLVGECYIHGYMNGEAVERMQAEKWASSKISLC